MQELNFSNRKVLLDIKYWGNQLIITISGGFNLSEMKTIKEEMGACFKNLGCDKGTVEIKINETANRLTCIATPPSENNK